MADRWTNWLTPAPALSPRTPWTNSNNQFPGGRHSAGPRPFSARCLRRRAATFNASRPARDLSMQAIVCQKPGALAFEERPEPARAAGKVLVQIRRVGICGTDYHIYEGTQPYLQYPRVMGHELSAEAVS